MHVSLQVLLRDPEEQRVIPIVEELQRRLPQENVVSSVVAVEEEERLEVNNGDEVGNRRGGYWMIFLLTFD